MMTFRSPFKWAQSNVSFVFHFIFTKNLFFKNCQNLTTFMKTIYDSYYLLFIFFSIQNMNKLISTDSPFISRLIHQYLFNYMYKYTYSERINTIRLLQIYLFILVRRKFVHHSYVENYHTDYYRFGLSDLYICLDLSYWAESMW